MELQTSVQPQGFNGIYQARVEVQSQRDIVRIMDRTLITTSRGMFFQYLQI